MEKASIKNPMVIFIWGDSRMVSNMERELSTIQTEISIQANLSMDCLKVSGLMHGRISLTIGVILSKVLEMAMEFGLILIAKSTIKGITCLIENMDMGSMIGIMGTYIRAILLRTRGLAKENFILIVSLFTKVSG